MKIKDYWKDEWFDHVDCTEDTCIFTFIEKNINRFVCDSAKKCYTGMIIAAHQDMAHEMKCYHENLIGLREDLRKNTDAMLTLIGLLRDMRMR